MMYFGHKHAHEHITDCRYIYVHAYAHEHITDCRYIYVRAYEYPYMGCLISTLIGTRK